MNSLLLQTKLDPEQRECAEIVRESAESLLVVINDILDVSKLEAGRMELELIDFDLVEIVEAAVDLLSPRAREKGIDISVFIDPAARFGFRGDPTRLRQVILNLIGNAIKFTEGGGVTVEVTLKPSPGDLPPLVSFEVSDTGIGLSEDAIGRLFEKFTQADTSISRRFGGTGLGLAISRQLVELMGGTIGAEGALGRGSRFHFTVPLPRATSPVIYSRSLPEQLRGLRVLLVDDVEINRRVLTRQFESLGMEIVPANDGHEALAELEQAVQRGRVFDLVVIDLMMPGLAGGELARRIRALSGITEARIIIVSSVDRYGLPSDLDELVDAVLTKPVREQSLVDTLARMVGLAATVQAPVPVSSDVSIPGGRALHILVAEDNRINQRLTTLLLKAAGHRADLVENGRQAVESVKANDYDLVLMDVQMPVLDGVKAARRIRSLPPPHNAVPIIALTADAAEGAAERCLAAGMDRYLAKPVAPDMLLACIDALVRGVPEKRPLPHATTRIDASAIATLRSVFTGEQFEQYIDESLHDLDRRVAQLGVRLDAHEIEAAAREAHDVVALAGNCGLLAVSELARHIERACRGGDVSDAEECCREIRRALDSAVGEFQEQLRTPTDDGVL